MNFKKRIDKILQFMCSTFTAILLSVLYISTLLIAPSITGTKSLTTVFVILSFSSIYLLLEYKSAMVLLFISIFMCFLYNCWQTTIYLTILLTLSIFWHIFIFYKAKLFSNISVPAEIQNKPFMGYLIIMVSVIVGFITLLSTYPAVLVNKYLPKGTNTSHLVWILLFFSALYKQYTSLIIFVGQPLDYDKKTFPFFKDALKFCIDTFVSLSMVYSIVLLLCLRFPPVRNFLLQAHLVKNGKKAYYLTNMSEFIFYVTSIFITLLMMSLLYQTLKFFFKSEWTANPRVESSLTQETD